MRGVRRAPPYRRGMAVAFASRMIQFALLALLRSGPDYGYRLRRRFDREIGPAWCLNVGQVYQSLQTLETKGLVREVVDPTCTADGGGPGRNRRTYAITEKGERTLERWLRRVPTRPRPLRDEILLRLLVAGQSGATATRQVLAASERAHRDRLDRAFSERRRAAAHGTPLGRLGLEAEISHLETHLGWLELCGRALLDAPPPEPRESAPFDARPPARALSLGDGATGSAFAARRATRLTDRA